MMVTSILVWHAAMLLACIPAAVLWMGDKIRKLPFFAGCFLLTVCVAWLPVKYVPMYELAFVVPLLALFTSLFVRGQWWRWAAGIPSAAIIGGLLYLATAAHMSDAMLPMQGAVNLPMFLRAKTAVTNNLNDPGSASFRNLRTNEYHGKWYVCGEVNARNRMGGLVGFTDFFVPVNDPLPFPVIVSNDLSSHLTYMKTCYGDDWDKINP